MYLSKNDSEKLFSRKVDHQFFDNKECKDLKKWLSYNKTKEKTQNT